MRDSLRLRTRPFVCWISALGFGALATAGVGESPCFRSAESAIEAIRPAGVLPTALERGGYRVAGIQSDPVLGKSWAMIVRCDHTEWPALAVQISRSDTGATATTGHTSVTDPHVVPVVHVGDVVRLWKQEDLLRIEVAGVSEESGGLGKIIRVRLLHRDAGDQATQEQLSGIVRGPSNVEMQR
jgi:hypothetical protein